MSCQPDQWMNQPELLSRFLEKVRRYKIQYCFFFEALYKVPEGGTTPTTASSLCTPSDDGLSPGGEEQGVAESEDLPLDSYDRVGDVWR